MNTRSSQSDEESATKAVHVEKARRRRRPFSATSIRSFLAVLLVTTGAVVEMRTAYLQSVIFSDFARALTFEARPGASEEVRFPSGGPYDQRLGYIELPSYIS